jgi:hypothetical protein
MTNATSSGIFSLLLILLLALSSCARLPLADVQYIYDSTINYTTYRTFGWYKAEVPTPVPGSAGPEFSTLLDERVKEAVATELVMQGLNPAAENPDLLVAYDIAVDTAQLATQASGFPAGYGYWYGYRYRYSHTAFPGYRPVQQYPVGTLFIDLIDSNTNELVWRGWVASNLNPAAVDEGNINVVVANIMSQFPPTPDRTR